MWNPKYFHEMITKRVIITTSVFPSQSWMRPSSPTLCRVASIRASGMRSLLNTMPVIASDSTYGTKNSSRKMARPGKRRLSRTASASENGIWRSERQDDDQHVVAHRLPEHVARQGNLVVLEPDEVRQRPEPVPLVQAEMRGLEDRDDDEDEVQRQRGQEEEADRQPLPRQPQTRTGRRSVRLATRPCFPPTEWAGR